MAKPPRSEAQRAASRANGRKSCGPRSAAGKSASRRNALKHGLRAASLAMVAVEASGSALTLAGAVRDRLAPADVIEDEISEAMALAFWRLRRAREIEDALVDGRDPAGAGNGLARVLLRRGHIGDALALVLRYRNQALGELARLRQLLDQHRRPASTEGQAPPATPSGPSGPANDNRPGNDSLPEGEAGYRPPWDESGG
jgi:hypothetical protein